MCEQIRQEICYTDLNVKIACSHGGVTPANDGASHQCIEDMGILSTLPNMTVIMPADYNSARKLVRAAACHRGPVYLRFTRDAVPEVYGQEQEFEIGKAVKLREGNDGAIIAIGDTVRLAVQSADELKARGMDVRVLDMHTLKPLDVEAVKSCLVETGRVVTVEDHNVINGLGYAVSAVAADMGRGVVKRIGIQDRFGMSAPYERLLAMNGITVENIVETLSALK
jgi:transketolase